MTRSSRMKALKLTAVMMSVYFCMMVTGAIAGVENTPTAPTIYFPMAHIFTFLILMLGPSKIIGPFVKLTAGAKPQLERRIALTATLFSGIALLIAGLLGELILRKHGVPLPVLALAGGIILFLVAIQDTIRQFSFEDMSSEHHSAREPNIKLALAPLAFPIIVTPYGIAALIVFLSFAADIQSQLTIGGMVVVILLLNFVAMLFARKLMTSLGVALAIVGSVLSVVQVALGLQIIGNSFLALNVF
ncbi:MULTISPECIES: MarC family protein [Falsihalocynthiibacter]|uniref:MarC family protein n=1 Tax=Falsihalocynthiibacter TaxID=2854182 RepID=UPI003001C6DB